MKYVPDFIQELFNNLQRYGDCYLDESNEKNGNYYRKRQFKMDGFDYKAIQINGNLLSLEFVDDNAYQ